MKIRILASTIALALLMPCLSFSAQAPTATLVGRVTDPSHAVVPDAAITVRSTDTNETRTAKTDRHGEYTVSALDPGNYDVLIEAPNFKPVHEAHLVLEADQSARLDAALVVGSTTQEVEVTTEVGALHTETSDKGDVIAPVEIAEMPLNGRDFNDLVFNVAGVMPAEEGSKGSSFVANGVRSDATSVMVDGLNNTNPRDAGAEATPPLDALQEFKVQTSNYSAEYGRVAGPVINLVVKKGTNKLKGSIFEFVRNDLFDARNHFDAVGTKSELRRNQFGGTLGGPVFIPRLYDGHNKTFFLFSWESYRDIDAHNQFSTVPTPAERSGDFSKSFNPNTGKTLQGPTASSPNGELQDLLGDKTCVTPGPSGLGNYIPAVDANGKSCYDPVSQSLLNFYPQQSPDLIGQPNNYRQSAKNRDTWDSFLLKIDQQLASKDEASIKGLRRTETSLNPFSGSSLSYWGSVTKNEQVIAAFTETHIFTPTIINEFRFGLTREVNNENSLDAGINWTSTLGIPGTTTDLSLAQFPQFKIQSYATLGDSTQDPIDTTTNNYDLNDSITWNKGKHTAKFGGDILKVQYFQPTNSGFSGSLGFNGKTSGNGLADFLRGGTSSIGLRVGTVVNHLHDASNSLFVQDDYKALPRLTLNLGLRYEYQALPSEENGQFSNFVPALNKEILGGDRSVTQLLGSLPGGLSVPVGTSDALVLAKDLGYPQTLIYPNHLRFAPRVGFALRLFNGNGTVLRGGYGIFYTGSRLTTIRTELSGQFPFSVSEDYELKGSSTIETAFTTTSPTAKGVNSVSGYDLHAPSAYIQSWNLTVERQLPKGLALEVAYTGSKGTHLGRQYDINQQYRTATNGINCKGSKCTYPRPFGGYTGYFGLINYFSFNSYSFYHSGTVTLRKRFDHGLMFRMNYTFGRSTDTASGLNYAGAGGFKGAQDANNPNAEYGRSDADRRHVLNGNWIYQLPLRKHFATRGWQLAGSVQAATGTPVTPQYTVPIIDGGQATRPDRICNGALPASQRSQNKWFDMSCFVQIPDTAYRFGNSGRNILDGPARLLLAASLSRSFPVRDYGSLQFRWEVFNATNHTNFNIPDDVLDEQSANTITKSGDPRVMQLGAKFTF